MSVEITHPDKVLFPDAGITKADLAGHYERVAEWMLPHVRGRPVSMQRFPDGIDGKGFFHKDMPTISRLDPARGGAEGERDLPHVVISTPNARYLVGQNTITPRVWLSRGDRIWQPDRLVIDLDPASGGDFAALRRAARQTGDLMREMGFSPVRAGHGLEGHPPVDAAGRRAPSIRCARSPAIWPGSRRSTPDGRPRFPEGSRGGRITWRPPPATDAPDGRECPHLTVRPRGAPVARAPIDWEELSDRSCAGSLERTNIMRRLGGKGDPWAEINSYARGISSRAAASTRF